MEECVLHSIILDLGWFKIASYGLMVAIGMLVGVWIATVRAKKMGESSSLILDLTVWVVLAGIIGARFFYVFIEGWTEVLSRPFGQTLIYFLKIRQGGLSFFGALAFSVPVGIIYLLKRGVNLWKIADIMAPSIAIGEAFARIGCFLNGCCFGNPCPSDAFYGVEFPVDSIPYQHYGGAVSVYPTQIISSINAFFIFLILSFLLRHRKFDGQIFWLFVLMYSVTRFFIDFIRGDSGDTFFGGLLFGIFTLAQAMCFIGAAMSIVMLVVLSKRARNKT